MGDLGSIPGLGRSPGEGNGNHSSTLAWKISWMEEPVGYSPWGRKELNLTKRLHFFIIGDWNAKVESQETPGVTDKFGLGIKNEEWQSLTKFCQENTLVIANTLFQQRRRRLDTWTSPDGHH